MNKGELKYIIVLVVTALLYLLVELTAPKQIDWNISLNNRDKNPFGSYLIYERLPDLFESIDHSYLTLFELVESEVSNLFILSERFAPDDADIKALLTHLENGNTVFIAANYFSNKPLLDTLGLEVKSIYFNLDLDEGSLETDSIQVNFNKNYYNTVGSFNFSSNDFHSYFIKTGSFNVLAETTEKQPVVIQKNIGMGSLVLCALPLAYTNNYLVKSNHAEFISNTLSLIPTDNVHWTEFYQSGRMEARTPLRYILSNDSLRFLYYLVLISLIVFVLFEMKRKQRIIPVIKPLTNTTLEFITVLGNLYFSKSNHKNIAEKRIAYFIQRLKEAHYIKRIEGTDSFFKEISLKTGNSEQEVKILFASISQIKNSNAISQDQLIEFSKQLDNFKLD